MTIDGKMLRVFIVFLCLIAKYTLGVEEKCERHQGVITRHCLKQCHTDSNCVSSKKACVCDGDCGKSCIHKNLRCKGLNNKLPHGRVDVLPYNQFGAVARYTCHDGFRLYGKSTRVCQGNEQWSGKEPECVLEKTEEHTECKEPPIVHNAIHDGGVHPSYAVGKQLYYTCNEGFIASPEKAIVTAWCVGGSGLWVGPRMQCAHAGCPLLLPIDFGTVEIVPPNMIGSKAKYSCIPGYHLAGRSERMCTSSGVWEGVEPSCERVACGPPPELDDAYHDGAKGQTSFPSGRQLIYSCNFGFTPHIGKTATKNPPRTMCDSSGRWTNIGGTCLPVVCGNPGDISNGWRQGFVFKYPSTVVYHCSEGYELVGRATRRCQPNGSWSGSIPNCKAVMCVPLEKPEHGHMNGSGFVYGSGVHFFCDKDYRVVGSDVRRCMADGSWSGHTTICQEINCGPPTPIFNGYLDGHKSTVGSVFKFRCDPLTQFSGEAFQTVCQKDGKWSVKTPKCWGQCQIPRINNASVTIGKADLYVDHTTEVTFTCDNGLVLDEPGATVCHNGSWTNIPACVPAPCKSLPPNIENGRRIFLGVHHKARARYTCLPGYRLLGDPVLVCFYGSWNGIKPSCYELDCPNPGKLEHGTVYKRGTRGKFEFVSYIKTIRHGTRLSYECNDGYERIGPDGATCVDGTWRPVEKPFCKISRHMSYQPRWHRFRFFQT